MPWSESMPATALRAASHRRGQRREAVLAYLYILPALLILLVFRLYPVANALFISLHNWGIIQESFVGLGNYGKLLADPRFWLAWRVTIYYVLASVPLTMAIALIVAVILFKKIALRGLFRTIYFIPYVTSLVAAAMVWKWIFHAQWGVLNTLIGALGGPEHIGWLLEPRGVFQQLALAWGWTVPEWAAGPSLALLAISAMSVWHFLGYDVVIFLAGLGNIPGELYEAARIDGANEWHLFWRITLPLLSPTTFFLTIMSTIGAFRSFNQFYVMTGGGPLDTTATVAYFVFKNFYNYTKVGYAAAGAILLFLVILVLTVVQLRAGGRHVTYQ